MRERAAGLSDLVSVFKVDPAARTAAPAMHGSLAIR
jgi:hypothetical protein